MSHEVMLIAGFCLTFACTGILQRFAQKMQLVDIPNERSSHVTPTPRGAGLIFAAFFLLFFSIFAVNTNINPYVALAYIMSASLVAGVGFMDDLHNISAPIRLACHALAVAVLFFTVNAHYHIVNEVWLTLFLLLSGAWLINLYNFMDGIDGIAAIQLLTVAAILLFEFSLVPGNAHLLFPLALMMTIIAGFILWNWAPAKIFMGDTGSYFIGFFFFYLILESKFSLLTWGILLSGFWVDATFTLLRRILTGQKWYQAHLTHAFQRLAIHWQSHSKVSITLALYNIIWLFPLSLISIHLPSLKWPLLCLSVIPSLVLCIKLQAGKQVATSSS